MQKRVLFLFVVCYRLCYEGQEEARAYEEEVLIPEREREEKKRLLSKSTRSKSDVVLLTRVGSKKKKREHATSPRPTRFFFFYLSLPSPAVKVVPTSNYLSKDLQVSSNKKKKDREGQLK